MSRFIIWSDLHQEFDEFEIPARADLPGPIDGVLLAGDTHTGMRHLDFAEAVATAYDCPVVMIDGNHEYYGNTITNIDAEEDRRLGHLHANDVPVFHLNGNSVVIAGTRIAGATLWTDFALQPARVPEAMKCAEAFMSDYRMIGIDDGGLRPLRTSDILARHRREKRTLWQTLATPFDGPTIVMTHHMPVAHAIHPRYASAPLLNAAFANNLGEEIAQFEFEAWICGHSHTIPQTELMSVNGMRSLVANPRGYPHEITGFDPLFVLEIPAH